MSDGPTCTKDPCQMATEIRDIHKSICGDEKHGHRGLVKRVGNLEMWAIFIAVYCLMVAGGAVAAWWFLEPLIAQAMR